MQYLITFLTSAAGAALIAGIFGVIQYRMKRADDKNDKKNAERKALRYLMLFMKWLANSANPHKTENPSRKHTRSSDIFLKKWYTIISFPTTTTCTKITTISLNSKN